ncbi:hypothetical protein [Colwellia piezophila]|uniref:hypothetical protein n=1 Tax=Colwellia piezophila TaxID=211668 RepID=UPI000361F7D2|nr:hypothetical protein [Colwellia piezophila]
MNKDALHKQGLFWIVISIPIIIGLVLFIPAICTYNFSWSVSGLVTFYEISKLQFSVMLLSIPIGALTARIHATIQREEDLAYKENDKQNEDDERVIEQIVNYINFIKNELTTKEIYSNNIENWRALNDDIGWIRAAKELIRIINFREEIQHSKNRQKCDDHIERLHLHLYRYLNNENEYLPLHFFTGSKNWKSDNKDYIKNKTNDDKNNARLLKSYIRDRKGKTSISYRSDPNQLAPRMLNKTINSVAIVCIFDFINLYVDSFIEDENPKEKYILMAKQHAKLIGWPLWDNTMDGWHSHEARASEGAAKFLFYYDKITKEISDDVY